jgi:hypothetical protein
VLYLSTSNRLCPVQNEFNLPLYSWYPGFLKRYFEHLAATTRPDLANYATYPAVNWFTFFSLRAYLVPLGMLCMDRFDVMDVNHRGRAVRAIRKIIQMAEPARCLAHMASVSTVVVAIKKTHIDESKSSSLYRSS